jgi:TonB family protein
MIAMKQAVSAALVHFVWQGLVVAFVLWTVLFVLRNRSANARYLASCAGLLSLTALPVITTCVLYQGTVSAIADGVPAGISRTIGAGLDGAISSPGKWLASIEAWALPLWSLGVVVFSLRLAWGCRQVTLLRREGVDADGAVLAMVADLSRRMGLTPSVRVLISGAADGPSVVGWIRPVILLPAATVLGLTPAQLEAVLAHECAHIRRHDYLVNFLQSLVETVLFYHPAVWWISARIRHERELCCDDLAVRSCGDVLCYARALASLERLRVTVPRLALGASDGPVLYRIQRLVGVNGRANRLPALPAVLALCLGLACFALTMNWARGQAQGVAAPRLPEERGVSVNLGGATVLHRSAIVYPRAAIEKRLEGVVLVQATLDRTGNVTDARVLSGPTELRKAALESVLKWYFTPGGEVSTRQISIAFHLPLEKTDSGSETTRPIQAAFMLEFLHKQYELASQQADAVSRKLRIVEADGHTLTAINIDVASGELRNALFLHLPLGGVHVGDTLSPSLIAGMEAAAKKFDEHLRVIPATVGDNQAVILITE